jgi:tetratricopeptide (TPR) repeat protein
MDDGEGILMAFGGEDAESYYDDGLTASMKGDLTSAAECFKKAIEKDPKFLVAYHQLGKCYQRMGASKPALTMLSQVVMQKPASGPFRVDYGQALFSAGQLDQAREQFTEVIAKDPSNLRGHIGLAQVCFAEANWAKAVAIARSALNQSGTNFGLLLILGRAAMVSGDEAEALEALKKADALLEKSIELNPDQPEGYYLRGEVAAVRKQYSSALEQYLAAELRAEQGKFYAAFGENFTFVDILAKQGLCYRRFEKYDRVRALGERIAAIDPNHRLGQTLRDLEG